MDNFIHQAYLADLSVCDELITLFNSSSNKMPGNTFGGVNKQQKTSTDISFHASEIGYSPTLEKYFLLLQKVCDQYIKLYPFCDAYSPWQIDYFNIQHYAPTEGYFAWHCERNGAHPKTSNRHLVWMTYLNDVDDAGGTEFLHQQQIIQPRKGLTLIWPADWTYTHRGVASPTEHKHIITGWYNYT
jgi:hypothetical protein